VRKSTHTAAYDALKAKLVALREARGLTQRDLAKKLKRNWSVVARIETGERRLDIVELYWLCEALGVDPSKVSGDIMKAVRAADLAEQKGKRP